MKIETPEQAAKVLGLKWPKHLMKPEGNIFIAIAQQISDLNERVAFLEEQERINRHLGGLL